MRDDLELRLREAAPLLYATGPCWGFQCGDGWFELLLTLSRDIEATLAITRQQDHGVSVAQVKEKFGGLRFYLGGDVTDAIAAMVSTAERVAARTCETCGRPGQLHAKRCSGWMRTLCEACAAANEYEACD